MRGRQQVPYIMILTIMPGLVIKLTLCTETEGFLDQNRLKKCLYQRERHFFVEGMRRLLSFVMLFRDSDDNIEAKIKALKVESDANIKSGSVGPSSFTSLVSGKTKLVFIERRSEEECSKMLNRCAPSVCLCECMLVPGCMCVCVCALRCVCVCVCMCVCMYACYWRIW